MLKRASRPNYDTPQTRNSSIVRQMLSGKLWLTDFLQCMLGTRAPVGFAPVAVILSANSFRPC